MGLLWIGTCMFRLLLYRLREVFSVDFCQGFAYRHSSSLFPHLYIGAIEFHFFQLRFCLHQFISRNSIWVGMMVHFNRVGSVSNQRSWTDTVCGAVAFMECLSPLTTSDSDGNTPPGCAGPPCQARTSRAQSALQPYRTHHMTLMETVKHICNTFVNASRHMWWLQLLEGRGCEVCTLRVHFI